MKKIQLTRIAGLAMILAGMFFWQSCEKQELSTSQELLAEANSQELTLKKNADFVFSMKNVRKAWQTLPNRLGTVSPTHLYVKFTPSNAKQMDALTEAKIPVYPYEIATDQLDASNPSETDFFTFLPVDKKIPDCPYQILDTVCLLDINSPLAQFSIIWAQILLQPQHLLIV